MSDEARSREREAIVLQVIKRANAGCAVPILMVLLGTIGALAIVALEGRIHADVRRPADWGQGVGILLALYWFTTPFFGLFAAALPKTGVVVGLLGVLAFLGFIGWMMFGAA